MLIFPDEHALSMIQIGDYHPFAINFQDTIVKATTRIASSSPIVLFNHCPLYFPAGAKLFCKEYYEQLDSYNSRYAIHVYAYQINDGPVIPKSVWYEGTIEN